MFVWVYCDVDTMHMYLRHRVVYLWCPRAVAAERIEARATGDTAERLRVWDATDPLHDADLILNTAMSEPAEVAHEIHATLSKLCR
jgi:hypothetical protein